MLKSLCLRGPFSYVMLLAYVFCSYSLQFLINSMAPIFDMSLPNSSCMYFGTKDSNLLVVMLTSHQCRLHGASGNLCQWCDCCFGLHQCHLSVTPCVVHLCQTLGCMSTQSGFVLVILFHGFLLFWSQYGIIFISIA